MVPALAPAEPKAAHPNPVVECRVRFGSTDDGVALELRITEAALIRRLVEEPLAAAKADPERAEWIVLGTVSLRRKDGNGEGFVLFSPLGKIKQNGAYL